MSEPAFTYAGFWRRFLSFWIDDVLLNLASLLIVQSLLLVYGVSAQDLEGGVAQFLSLGATGCVGFLYFSLSHYQWGRTAGKRLLGVRVINERTGGRLSAGQAMGRSLALVLSIAFFGVGFLMVAFDSRKRALHDRLAGTVCIRSTGSEA